MSEAYVMGILFFFPFEMFIHVDKVSSYINPKKQELMPRAL